MPMATDTVTPLAVFFRHVCEERPLNSQNMREWTLVRTLGRRDAVTMLFIVGVVKTPILD